MSDKHLVDAAIKLTEALNWIADESLPGKLAGIVKLHAVIAVGSALIPIPGADVAAATANIWTMYVRINRESGLPFSENVMKSVGVGVATNLGTGVVGVLAVALLLKLIPIWGSAGGAAIMGATVYGVTLASGIIYMNAIAKLLRKKEAGEISEVDLKDALDKELSDKAAVKDIVKEAKKDHKDRK